MKTSIRALLLTSAMLLSAANPAFASDMAADSADTFENASVVENTELDTIRGGFMNVRGMMIDMQFMTEMIVRRANGEIAMHQRLEFNSASLGGSIRSDVDQRLMENGIVVRDLLQEDIQQKTQSLQQTAQVQQNMHDAIQQQIQQQMALQQQPDLTPEVVAQAQTQIAELSQQLQALQQQQLTTQQQLTAQQNLLTAQQHTPVTFTDLQNLLTSQIVVNGDNLTVIRTTDINADIVTAQNLMPTIGQIQTDVLGTQNVMALR